MEKTTYGPISLLVYTMSKKTDNLSTACSFPEINHQSVVDASLILDNFPASEV